MFTISNNLKRSWQILWHHKTLWIFAVLLMVSGGVVVLPYSNAQGLANTASLPYQWTYWINLSQYFTSDLSANTFTTYGGQLQYILTSLKITLSIWIGLMLIFSLIRYPAEVAIIRMVDGHEFRGIQVNIKVGWKLGWTLRSVRVWLMDLFYAIPVIFISAVIFRGWFQMMQSLTSGQVQSVEEELLAFLIYGGVALLIYTPISFIMGMFRELTVRAVTLENIGVWGSFTRAWAIYKSNSSKALLLELLVYSMGLASAVPTMLAMSLFIPVFLVMAIPGALVAAIPAGVTYGLATLFGAHTTAWVATAVVAGPILVVIMLLPLALLCGLAQLYFSSNWTLAYRQLIGETPPAVPVTPPAAEIPAEPVQ